MKTTTAVVRTALFAVAAMFAFVCAGRAATQDKPEAPKTQPAANGTPAKDKLTKKVPYPAAKALPPQAEPPEDEDINKEAGPKMDKDSVEQILKRDAWFYKQRASADGRIPVGARARALEHMRRRMEEVGKLTREANGAVTQIIPAVTSTWTSIGPTPTTGGEFSPVTGRITTIAVDPSEATGSTVLIGGAQGGIWRTPDAGATWTAVGDQNASLAMGSIAFAASACNASPNPCTVYAGTGEQASIGFDIYYGAGVLKSTDHGQTWTQTCTTPSLTCPFIGPVSDQSPFGFFTLGGTRISYISVNPGNANMVLVGAQTQFTQGKTEGVYCTDNGGTTWSNVLSGEMSTFVGFTSATAAFAALGNPFGGSATAPNGNGIYQATGIGALCTSVAFSRLTAATLPAQSSIGRIDIGVSPNFAADRTMYASIADAGTRSNTDLGVFVSTDGGTTWAITTAPDVCRQQCWYDNVVKVDPNGGAHAFFAGGAVFVGNAPGWVQRTANTGGSWSTIIPNALGLGLPHVDNHAMTFVKPTVGPNAGKVRMFLGNDGGIWGTDDAEATPVVWTNLNKSALTLTQFYPALSIHPSNPGIAFGGTQDNGSQDYTGTPSWVDNKTCGDGTGTAIDNVFPSTVYVACNGLNLAASVVNGVPGSFSVIGNGINGADASDFVPPLATDPNTANTVYAGSTKVYQSVDGGQNFTALSGDLVTGANNALTAISVAPGAPAVVYAAATTGQVFVATNVAAGTGTFAAVAGQASLPPRIIRNIAIDALDATGKTAYAGFSGFAFGTDTKGHVFKTTDGGATWVDVSCTGNCITPVSTDLPNTPVNDVVVDPDVNGLIYAATDIGVYIGNCSGAPTVCIWSPLSTGLPHVAVLSLKIHRASRTLRAATHGRGMWDIILNNHTFAGPHISSISPVSAVAGAAQRTLTVNGNGLTGGTVQWKAGATTTPLTTTFVNDGQLTATVPVGLLAGGGAPTVSVTVAANTSNGLTFVVLGAAPTLTSIAPTNTPTQNPPATSKQITLTGTGFTSSSQVLFNRFTTGVTTAFTSATSLTATLAASLLGPAGSTNDIQVLNPPPGGGASAAATFVVQSAVPANDAFANATALAGTSGSVTEDSSAATTASTDPILPTSCVQQANGGGGINGSLSTVWFKFTPGSTGTFSVNTIGSNYDTTLAVFTGTTAGALTLVPNACNDDISPGVIIQSQLTGIALTGGTTYSIMVGSFGPPDPNPIALGGALTLNFTFSATPVSTFTVSGTAATATAGNKGTSTITVTPSNGFTSAGVAITCTNLPPGVTCTPNPLNIPVPNANPATGMLTVNVTANSPTMIAANLPAPSMLPNASGRRSFVIVGAGTGLTAMILLLLPGRRWLRAALGLGLVCLISLALGCGGGYGGGGGGGTIATTTQITVSSTKVAQNGSLTVSAMITPAAGGSVQFFVDGAPIGQAAPLTNGTTGQITVTAANAPAFLPLVGTHTLSAHYTPATGYGASQSGTLNITVMGTTAVTLTANPAASNANATFNLTIN